MKMRFGSVPRRRKAGTHDAGTRPSRSVIGFLHRCSSATWSPLGAPGSRRGLGFLLTDPVRAPHGRSAGRRARSSRLCSARTSENRASPRACRRSVESSTSVKRIVVVPGGGLDSPASRQPGKSRTLKTVVLRHEPWFAFRFIGLRAAGTPRASAGPVAHVVHPRRPGTPGSRTAARSRRRPSREDGVPGRRARATSANPAPAVV